MYGMQNQERSFFEVNRVVTRQGLKRTSTVQVMFYILIWIIVIWACSLCDN